MYHFANKQNSKTQIQNFVFSHHTNLVCNIKFYVNMGEA